MWALYPTSGFFAAGHANRLCSPGMMPPWRRSRCKPTDRPAGRSHAAEAAMKSLTGQLLVAMPQMMDPRFARSVVYICAHSEEAGAMGLVINKLLASLTMDELFAHLKLEPARRNRARPVHFCGPLAPRRWFVLHTADYSEESTLPVRDEFPVTPPLDIPRGIGRGGGPQRRLLA